MPPQQNFIQLMPPQQMQPLIQQPPPVLQQQQPPPRNAQTKSQQRITLGNLHFQQDPNDPQKWIITNDSGPIGSNAGPQQPAAPPPNNSQSNTVLDLVNNMSSNSKKQTKRIACNCPNCISNQSKPYVQIIVFCNYNLVSGPVSVNGNIFVTFAQKPMAKLLISERICVVTKEIR
jgi:hypothetical protein